MNCKAMESLIALFIEDDLSSLDRQRVETHLHECAACSALADDLQESQSMFKALRAGSVNSSDLAGVRARVLNEVGDLDPAPGWVLTMHRLFFAGLRRRNAIAGVSLAVLVSGSVWYSQKNVLHEVKNEAPVEVVRLDGPPVAVSEDLVPPPPETQAPRISKPTALQTTPVEVLSEAHSILAEPDPISPQLQVTQVPPMKFVTDDPDIIIYWLPSDKGD